jgi:hypothetical protein
MRSRRSPLIDLANSVVPILDVCRWAGISVPTDTPPRSLKVRCPFTEIAHTDQSPAMRIFPDTNGAYCFSCGYFSPVWLTASVEGVSQTEAAKMLLDRVGYQPASAASLWEMANAEPTPDTTALSQTLRLYCGRIDPTWGSRQFETGVGAVLDRCLALLSYVRSGEQANEWLIQTKLVMQRVLGGDGHGRERSASTGGLADLSRSG